MRDDHPSILPGARIALLFSGAVSVIAGLAHPDDTVAGGVLSPAWVPVHAAQVLAFGLAGYGAAALVFRRPPPSRLALVGFWVNAVAAFLCSGASLLEAAVLPRLMRGLARPIAVVGLIGPGAPFPELAWAILPAVLLYVAGWVLLGVCLFRQAGIPRAASVLLICGAVLQLAPLPGIGHGLTIAMHGVALVWLALAVRSPAEEVGLPAKPQPGQQREQDAQDDRRAERKVDPPAVPAEREVAG